MKNLRDTKSVIRTISYTTHSPDTWDFHRDWSEVYGPSEGPLVRSQTGVHYQHKETGAEYAYLMGGFAPPGNGLSGFAVVIALDRKEDPRTGRRIIRCLEEVEASSLNELIWECMRLQIKYGADPVLTGWAADIDQVTWLRVAEITRVINKDQDLQVSFFPRSGTYSGYPNSSFRDYLSILAEHQSSLDRGSCERLRSYMDRIHSVDMASLRPEDNPAVAALAYAVTELMVHKGWEGQVREEYYPDEEKDPWDQMQY